MFKHLVPFHGDNSSGNEADDDSRANRFDGGENDGDEAAATAVFAKNDPLAIDAAKARAD
ncbi:hypothetical protein C2S51_010520 [Perilla frutescens var. frutescens]|nr:hypothetical protein C2S51_010520 [Perilla frutescens var. frutescens]